MYSGCTRYTSPVKNSSPFGLAYIWPTHPQQLSLLFERVRVSVLTIGLDASPSQPEPYLQDTDRQTHKGFFSLFLFLPLFSVLA